VDGIEQELEMLIESKEEITKEDVVTVWENHLKKLNKN